MSRAVGKLRSVATPLLGTVFDRWRQFVKLRKLVLYLASKMENSMTPVKADLSVCFARWQRRFEHQKSFLNAQVRHQLLDRKEQQNR